MELIKKVGAMLLLLMCCVSVFGQTEEVSWFTSYEDAMSQAEKENKIVLMNFSGSDWCRACMILKKTILETDEFKSYAKDHLVLLNVDFPRQKKHALTAEQIKKNEGLAKKYNPKGYFPTVVMLNPQGEVLGTTGFKKLSPAEYVEHIKELIQ